MHEYESKNPTFDDQIICNHENFGSNFSSFITNELQNVINVEQNGKSVINKTRKRKPKVATSDKKKVTEYSLSMEWGDNKDEKVEELYRCYHKSNLDSLPYLLEDLELSEKQPTIDGSIFFLITTCFANNLLLLGKR